MSKRRQGKRHKDRQKAGRQQERGRRRRALDWPAAAGQAAIIAGVVATPLLINRRSGNICDVKDTALGLLVAVGLSGWVVASLRTGRLRWARSPLTPAVLAFALWAGLTLTYSRYWFVTISEFGRLAAHLGLFWLALSCLLAMSQVRRVVRAACAAAAVVAGYAFLQAAGVDPIDWATPTARVFSLLGNPTYLGSYVALLLPVAVAIGWPGGERPGWRLETWLLWGVAALLAVALYLSFTLGAAIGLFLGGLLALGLAVARAGPRAVARWAPRAVAAVGALALVLVVAYLAMPAPQQRRVRTVLSGRDPYAGERHLHWRVARELFRERPLIGHGYGTFRILALERLSPEWYMEAPRRRTGMLVPGHAHNEYLQVLAGTGLVGGALFAWVLAAFYWVALPVAIREPHPAWRRLALGIVAGVTAFLFQNNFGVTFRQTGAVTFFWLWLGVVAVAGARLDANAAERGVEAEPRLREVPLRRLGWPATAAVAVALAAVVAALGWLAIRPIKAALYLRQAQAAGARGYYQPAAELAEKALALNPYSAVAYYTAAYARGQLGELEQAVELNRRALELLPGNASFSYNLGVSYKKLGKLDEALEYFQRAVELMPTSGQHHAALAETLLERGELDRAQEHMERAVELEPRNPTMRIMLANIAFRRGDPEEGVRQLERASGLDPANLEVRRQLAEYLIVQRQYEPAKRAYERWIEAAPESPNAWNGLGTCQFHLGELPQALRSFERALALDPPHQRAALNLANTYGRMGNHAQARQWLERVERMDPRSAEGREARRVLNLVSGARPR